MKIRVSLLPLLTGLMLSFFCPHVSTQDQDVIPDFEPSQNPFLAAKEERAEIMDSINYLKGMLKLVMSGNAALQSKLEGMESTLLGFGEKIVSVESGVKVNGGKIDLLGQKLDVVVAKNELVREKVDGMEREMKELSNATLFLGGNLQSIEALLNGTSHVVQGNARELERSENETRVLRRWMGDSEATRESERIVNYLALIKNRTQSPDFNSQEEYQNWLKAIINGARSGTSIEDGASIGGRSISSISSSLPSEYQSLTLEIVNHQEEPLIDLQTLLHSVTTPHGTNPTKVDAKRREVFVYRASESALVSLGALSFRIGTENQRVAFFFRTDSPAYYSRFAMALTTGNTTFHDLGWAKGSNINHYPSELVVNDNFPLDYVLIFNVNTTSTFSLENDLTYVRAMPIPGEGSIWRIDVFPKPKTQDLVPSRSALLGIIPSGESYRGKTALAFMESAPGTGGIFLELVNGLGLPLQSATSYTTSSSNLVPNIIASATREIMHWTTTDGNLEALVTYQIGTSDVRLAVAANANPSSGNKFGLKFVSNNTVASSSLVTDIFNLPQWERSYQKVGQAGSGAIAIQMRNLRVTASMTGEPKSLLNVFIEKYF